MGKLRCKYCKWFLGDLMSPEDEVLDKRGVCICKWRSPKETAFDDYCNNFAVAMWAEKKEEE
jgi:hypothetical protein